MGRSLYLFKGTHGGLPLRNRIVAAEFTLLVVEPCHRQVRLWRTSSTTTKSFYRFIPYSFQRLSTRAFISGVITMSSGQSRVKPSEGHFRVASMPIFEPALGKIGRA